MSSANIAKYSAVPSQPDGEVQFNSQPPPGQGYPPHYSPQYQPLSQSYQPPGQNIPLQAQPQQIIIVQEPPVNSCLAVSILNLLCCCLPFGIAAVVFSLRANEALDGGKIAEARKNALVARNLNIAGCTIGGVAIIAVIVITVFVFVVGISLASLWIDALNDFNYTNFTNSLDQNTTNATVYGK